VKKVQLLLTFALGGSHGPGCAIPLTGDDAKQVLAREQASTAALEHSDVATLERIMADDVTYIHASEQSRYEQELSGRDSQRTAALHLVAPHDFACAHPGK
jgi:hypothetical protein